MKKKYIVRVTKTYLDDGCPYRERVTLHETWAVSPEKAENNVRFRIIGKKYNLVDHQPYNERYSEEYKFKAIEPAFK